MFVLFYHKAFKDYEFFCATLNHRLTGTRCNILQESTESMYNHTQKKNKIFASCGLTNDNDVFNFVNYSIAIRQYFYGPSCKITYLKNP